MVWSMCLPLNFRVNVGFGSTRFSLETLETERGADVAGRRKRGGDVVSPGKVKVEEFEEFGILSHDFEDELAGKGFVAETLFEF